MTASNLSFATKDYLQRYGLVTNTPQQQQATPTAIPPPQQTPINRNIHIGHHHHNRKHSSNKPEKDRILNMTVIKNQPKLF